MSRKTRLIIPIFIPFGGCPHQCVFCDQNRITGEGGLPSPEAVGATIENYLSTWKGSGPREAAFYGGSFTGLPRELQERYLSVAFEYVKDGRLDSVRLSTRPDYITEEIIGSLKPYAVKTVELGVQSMSDEVLRLSGRGHTAADTVRASGLLKGNGIALGVQFMPGLPGDDRASVIDTTQKIIDLEPDFVRVYPTLVLRDTPLHRMYCEGRYVPWGLDEMVSVCREAAALLKKAGISIIRMGLQPTEELEKSLEAGPYHPSFRQLVTSGG